MEKLENTPKIIKFEYVPSHKDIPGNKQADSRAQYALDLPHITQIPLEYTEFKTSIKKYLKQTWQNKWDRDNLADPDPLYEIKPVIKDWMSVNKMSREQEIILTRLRLGAGLFNRKHKIDHEPHPQCQRCNTNLDIPHVLLICPQYNQQRMPIKQYLRRHNLPLTLNSILNDDFPHSKLFKYLEDIKYTSKI